MATVKIPKKLSEGEEALALHIRAHKLPKPSREYRFRPTGRRWRFDYAWPELALAVEVEGGTWGKKKKSGHTTGSGFEKDCEKYNAAALDGWAVLRYTTKMVMDGRAIDQIEKTIQRRLELLLATLA